MDMKQALIGLNPLFHSPNRLAIVSCLASVDTATYQALKEYLGLSYPSLSKNISTLEEAEIVSVSKNFIGKKPENNLAITRKGRRSFEEYLACLDQIVTGFRAYDDK